MKRILMTAVAAFALCFASILPQSADAQRFFWEDDNQGSVIERIAISGNQRIEQATIESYLDIKPGDRASEQAISRSVRALYATGLFADVEIVADDRVLRVDVSENPVINEIAFEGNRKLEDSELLAEISLRPRTVLTRSKVQDNLDRLNTLYRRSGRFSATIEPKVIRRDQNRVDLVFEIEEGEVTKVKDIQIVGNENYSDAVLKAEMATREKRWYRFLSSNDRYDPDRMQFDQELLRRFYLNQGYVDFQVKSAVAELSQDKEYFFLTFTVEEGERYKVGSMTIDSELVAFDVEQLYPSITLKTGEWYSANELKKTTDSFQEILGNAQYAFVDITPDIRRDVEDNTVDITFRINETPRVFVERIDIKGNVRTLDKVVRREFEFVEGDPFNREKLADSTQNIRNLGFFEDVTINPTPGSSADKTVIEAQVSEKSTGEISIGAGFSTSDGPLADFRIRERNLLGTGRDLGLTTVVAGERSEFDLSLSEPYFLNRDLRLTTDVFHITRDYQDESSFDQKRTGAGIGLNYPLSEELRQTVRYRIEQNKIENVSSDASLFIRLQEEDRATSAISQRLTYDTRDSRLSPSEGLLGWLDTELAGLGGDAKYVSAKLGAEKYYELREGWIFSVLGEVAHIEGYGDEDVTISERFFIGGTSLRGFERSGIGPRDLTTDDALGGNSFYRGSVELSAPLSFANGDDLGLKWHVFSDFGSLIGIDQDSTAGVDLADDGSIRASVGVGLSWRSPFGPLRFDLAAPIAKEDYDEDEVFRFSFGTRF